MLTVPAGFFFPLPTPPPIILLRPYLCGTEPVCVSTTICAELAEAFGCVWLCGAQAEAVGGWGGVGSAALM